MEMMPKNRDSRCTGLTKGGKSCRAAATDGGLCYFHANPKKAAELGRIGGRKNRHVSDEHLDPLPGLEYRACCSRMRCADNQGRLCRQNEPQNRPRPGTVIESSVASNRNKQFGAPALRH